MRLQRVALVLAGSARYRASKACACVSTGELMYDAICTRSVHGVELRKLLLPIQSAFNGVAVA